MIELYEFIQLDFDEQAELIWQDGSFRINLKEDNYSYNLYSFFGYFVEVKLSYPENQIVDIKPFRNGEIQNKYLEFIEITELN